MKEFNRNAFAIVAAFAPIVPVSADSVDRVTAGLP